MTRYEEIEAALDLAHQYISTPSLNGRTRDDVLHAIRAALALPREKPSEVVLAKEAWIAAADALERHDGKFPADNSDTWRECSTRLWLAYRDAWCAFADAEAAAKGGA